MRKTPYLAILSALFVLVSCGGGNAPSSSSEISVPSTPSEPSSTPSEPSVPSSESGSATNVGRDRYGTEALFLKNYSKLFALKVYGVSYYQDSSSDYEKSQDVTIVRDEDEIVTTIEKEEGVSTDYKKLTSSEYYEVENDSSFTSKAARYKIVDNPTVSDEIVLTNQYRTGAKDKFDSAIEKCGLSGIVKTVEMNTVRSKAVTQTFEYVANDDGTGSINYRANESGSYYGYVWSAELEIDAKGRLESGFFKKRLYYTSSGQWDSENNCPAEGVTDPTYWISTSISQINYNSPENTALYNSDRYFLTSVSGLEFEYYEYNTKTASVDIRSDCYVGDVISTLYLGVDSATVSPKSALDRDTLYITGSSNPDVFVSTSSGYKAIATGTTTITVGNSFVPNAGSIEITVIERPGGDVKVNPQFTGSVESDNLSGEPDWSEYNEGLSNKVYFPISGTAGADITINVNCSEEGPFDEEKLVIVKDESDTLGLDLEYVGYSGTTLIMKLSGNGTAGTGHIGLSSQASSNVILQFNVTLA